MSSSLRASLLYAPYWQEAYQLDQAPEVSSPPTPLHRWRSPL